MPGARCTGGLVRSGEVDARASIQAQRRHPESLCSGFTAYAARRKLARMRMHFPTSKRIRERHGNRKRRMRRAPVSPSKLALCARHR